MSLQPITLWGHASGPNPWKVVFILEELSIPYEHKYVEFDQIKKEPYVNINPNGRVPAIEDPNTGITLWESGAILEYLVETYDKEHTISFPAGTPEYFHAKQWLHFQMSGQGPYFGQAVWFTVYHPEKIESAKERYFNEVRRVSGVLDKWLEGREYLVGNKYSYVDSAFTPWYAIIPKITGDSIGLEKDFPNLNAWLNRIKERPAIAKVV
ncbi:glutathione S-transferase family protein [Aspergillus clavatus NRRL 1]|uniref:glutathione transferase n=1 Tax=Aspergillus clavatus (strain ATCC 1007 / CBS 513.65 / DSM 816 / NCTC 3887 / NRRL 1 / QM 1276 / 107) TaxID=344612 RepID=A1CDN3_ASPCL|nr:glutathione S-transferase, putative [Aspergillus clavatus NRRL 1]EAW11960.1 glutathione S-transferase, putative [Aspergillus clavatus NRRL 1]